MKNYPYHAIQRIGAGKRSCYILVKVVSENLLMPADNHRFRTESAAQVAANELGLKISAVGDLYEII